MAIEIILHPYNDLRDDDDHTGLTDDAYSELADLLMQIGEMESVRRVD